MGMKLTGHTRLGRMLRVSRSDLCRDAKGGKEQDLAPRQSVGKADGLAGARRLNLHTKTLTHSHTLSLSTQGGALALPSPLKPVRFRVQQSS